LVEVKWSPHRLAKAKKAGVEPLRALRVIRKRGRWCSAPTVGPGQPKSGKRAAAPYVGLLCVCMGAYCLKLYEGSSRRHSHRIKGRIQLRASGPARAAARALLLAADGARAAAGGAPAASDASSSAGSSSSSSGLSGYTTGDTHDAYSTDSESE